jgi:hypothetical protein
LRRAPQIFNRAISIASGTNSSGRSTELYFSSSTNIVSWATSSAVSLDTLDAANRTILSRNRGNIGFCSTGIQLVLILSAFVNKNRMRFHCARLQLPARM